LCLFIHMLPFPSVLRLWDILFCKGPSALVIAAFSIIYFKKVDIIAKTDYGPEYLDKLCQYFYSWEELTEVMFTVCSFSQVEKLQEDALRTISIKIRQSQIEEIMWRGTFTSEELEILYNKFLQKAKNECVTMDDFKLLLPEELECFTTNDVVFYSLFNFFDKNGFGLITFREFGLGLNSLLRADINEKIRSIFHIFDIDTDEFISKEELRFMLQWQFRSMGFANTEVMVQASVDMALENFDKDKDKLTLEEFGQVVKKQPFFLKLT